jgi:predicted PurR-regulated permease PerM
VFGGFWGIVGLLFAIPLATLCQAVIRVWTGSLKKEASQTEFSPPADTA